MKFRILAVCSFLLIGSLLAAQTIDSTIHVKEYPGATVGAKVTAAMASCPTGTVPCILVVDPSLAAWVTGTMPSLCSNCVLSDFRSYVGPASLPGFTATQFAGSDLGAKLNSGANGAACANSGGGSNLGNIIYIPAGVYSTATPITINTCPVRIIAGVGSAKNTNQNATVQIIYTGSTAAPVFSFTGAANGSILQGVSILNSGSATAAVFTNTQNVKLYDDSVEYPSVPFSTAAILVGDSSTAAVNFGLYNVTVAAAAPISLDIVNSTTTNCFDSHFHAATGASPTEIMLGSATKTAIASHFFGCSAEAVAGEVAVTINRSENFAWYGGYVEIGTSGSTAGGDFSEGYAFACLATAQFCRGTLISGTTIRNVTVSNSLAGIESNFPSAVWQIVGNEFVNFGQSSALPGAFVENDSSGSIELTGNTGVDSHNAEVVTCSAIASGSCLWGNSGAGYVHVHTNGNYGSGGRFVSSHWGEQQVVQNGGTYYEDVISASTNSTQTFVKRFNFDYSFFDTVQCGLTTDQSCGYQIADHTGAVHWTFNGYQHPITWQLSVVDQASPNSPNRFALTPNQNSYLNSASTGVIRFNMLPFSGSGGIEGGAGDSSGSTPSATWSISGAGAATFTGITNGTAALPKTNALGCLDGYDHLPCLVGKVADTTVPVSSSVGTNPVIALTTTFTTPNDAKVHTYQFCEPITTITAASGGSPAGTVQMYAHWVSQSVPHGPTPGTTVSTTSVSAANNLASSASCFPFTADSNTAVQWGIWGAGVTAGTTPAVEEYSVTVTMLQ